MLTKFNKMALAIAGMILSGSSIAATSTSNMSINGTVSNICSIGDAIANTHNMSLNFVKGVPAVTTDEHFSSTVPVICTNGASAIISVGPGATFANGFRQMVSGINKLSYALFTDSALTIAFGSTDATGIAITGTGATTTANIYGLITAQQLALAVKGNYADTVAMTITYTP